MKKAISLMLALVLCFSLCACGGTGDSTKPDVAETPTPTNAPIQNVEIKTSPDKYTWYIKNYVGKNAASLGYTSMGGDRMESYGNGYLRLVFQAPNGEFIDIHNEDSLKEWRVIAQSLAPNTELKYILMAKSMTT